MTIPNSYKWLENISPLPKIVSESLALLGTLERPGAGSNPSIISWAKETGLAAKYSSDDIPWCGLFVALVAQRAGKEVVANPLWARNWEKFGTKSPSPSLGDVLVFVRNGGGHVGIYIGEDARTYHVLGGNQSDKVCIVRIQKSRCVAVRRPIYNVQPFSVKPYHLSIGGSVSTNEA